MQLLKIPAHPFLHSTHQAKVVVAAAAADTNKTHNDHSSIATTKSPNLQATTPKYTPFITSVRSLLNINIPSPTSNSLPTRLHTIVDFAHTHQMVNILNLTNDNTDNLEITLHIPKTMSDQPPNLAELLTNLLKSYHHGVLGN
jgi:hypothetical protein